MEHLALGLVCLLGMLVSISPMAKQVKILKKALDKAPKSFDDQYLGCSQMMEEELNKLNRSEFKTNRIYALAWKKARAEWQKTPPSSVLKPAQAIAVMACTLETPALYKKFHPAVQWAGRSRKEYLHKFHYKVLHFLLTEAVRNLREAQQNRCYQVYRGVPNIIYTPQSGQRVRFGQFASTSLNKTSVEIFGQGTTFSVKTCYGVSIRDFSAVPGKRDILIPPFEVFDITNVTQKSNGVHIELHTQGVYSKYNCEYVKEKRCKNQPCIFNAGQSVTWNPLWGFLLAVTALATTVGN